MHPHFSDYGLLWSLHQLAPYIDKALLAAGVMGEAGAVDARALGPLDWAVRLPMIVLALCVPSRPVLIAAHGVNLALWAYWMPQCWDHMCWAATMELTFVLCALLSDERTALAAARTQMVCLYLCAAFWKLTTSFLDPRTSCASVLFAELAATVVPAAAMPAASGLAKTVLHAAPLLTVFAELLLGPLLGLVPLLGVAYAAAFHLSINILPLNCAPPPPRPRAARPSLRHLRHPSHLAPA